MLLGMTDTDEAVDNEVTELDTETEDQVPTKNKQKRMKELKTELAELEGEDEIGDTVDTDVAEVTYAVDDEAEEIAEGPANTEEQVEQQADAAAEGIAQTAKRQGVTFTDEEIDGISRRIVKRAKEIEAEGNKPDEESSSDEKPSGRTRERRAPDRRPRGTHFSERQLFGKGRK